MACLSNSVQYDVVCTYVRMTSRSAMSWDKQHSVSMPVSVLTMKTFANRSVETTYVSSLIWLYLLSTDSFTDGFVVIIVN